MGTFQSRTAAVAVMTGAALFAAACGSSSKAASTAPTTALTTTPATAAPAASGSPAAAATVTATLTDFHIAMSPSTLAPGRYTVVIKDAGAVPHSLVFSGAGGTQALGRDLQPGQSANMTVNLQAGTYDVFCPVPGHKEMGMDLQLQVASTAGATPAAPAPTTAPTPTTAASHGYGGGY